MSRVAPALVGWRAASTQRPVDVRAAWPRTWGWGGTGVCSGRRGAVPGRITEATPFGGAAWGAGGPCCWVPEGPECRVRTRPAAAHRPLWRRPGPRVCSRGAGRLPVTPPCRICISSSGYARGSWRAFRPAGPTRWGRHAGIDSNVSVGAGSSAGHVPVAVGISRRSEFAAARPNPSFCVSPTSNEDVRGRGRSPRRRGARALRARGGATHPAGAPGAGGGPDVALALGARAPHPAPCARHAAQQTHRASSRRWPRPRRHAGGTPVPAPEGAARVVSTLPAEGPAPSTRIARVQNSPMAFY